MKNFHSKIAILDEAANFLPKLAAIRLSAQKAEGKAGGVLLNIFGKSMK